MNNLFNQNTDDALRQSIMGINAAYGIGGIERFSGMTLKTLDRLAEHGFIDLEASFNRSPKMRAFKNFMERHVGEGITAHGYAVSPERADCCIVIEGLEAQSPNRDFRAEFTLVFEEADELDCEMEHDTARQYCWYD